MYYHINTSALTIISGPHAAQSTYIKKLTYCGNPECLDLASYDLVPRVFATLAEGEKHGEPVVYADRVEIPAVPKTAEDLKAETFVASITPRQCRIYLKRSGILNNIKQMVNAMDEEAQIEWEYATEIKRDHPLVLQMAAVLNMTENDLHTMFFEASKI